MDNVRFLYRFFHEGFPKLPWMAFRGGGGGSQSCHYGENIIESRFLCIRGSPENCWNFVSDYLYWLAIMHKFCFSLTYIEIFNNATLNQSKRRQNYSLWYCRNNVQGVSKKTEFSRNQLWEIFFWLVRNPIGLLFWQIQLCYYRTMCFNVIVICSIWAT